jgi:GT2 family glycosyltransferase
MNPIQIPNKFEKISISYIQTSIASAAQQRNIGLERVSRDTSVLFFLDDDTFPRKNYFDDLELILKNNERVVGASGIALNPNSKFIRKKPVGIKGLVQRIFFLDSKIDGKLLKSAVNIPVRTENPAAVKVDWLITCSAWKFDSIKSTRFEQDFIGASLGEDVIFSIRMKSKGDLMVNSKTILDHLESTSNRPSTSEFWTMWMTNRFRIMKVSKFRGIWFIFFWWSSFGQLLINFFVAVCRKSSGLESVRGILNGTTLILRKRI